MRGSFSPENATWSRASDLRSTSWDPYPELQPKIDCYGNQQTKENYDGCSTACCGQYGVQVEPVPNLIPQQSYGTKFDLNTNYITGIAPVPLDYLIKRQVPTIGNQVEEGYLPCCRPNSYDQVRQTWKTQTPFTL